MKVVYFSSPPFFDYDISLVNHLRKHCEVYLILNLPPFYLRSTAVNISCQLPVADIFSAWEYEDLRKFEQYVDYDKFYVINRVSKKSYSSSNLKLQKKVKSLVDEINPKIIHYGFHLGLNFAYFLLTNKRRCILTVHDPFPHSGASSKRGNFNKKYNYFFIKNILLLSNFQRADFENKFKSFRFKRIFQSKLGIYEYLSDFKGETLKSDQFSILFFGRIESYKGVKNLLIAFDKLSELHENINLTIAGKGKFDFDISKYTHKKNVIILNRFIPNEELASLIRNTTLVVCPYLDATQSGVLMSAFTMGKAVLATNVGGFSEIINPNVNGFLVPPNNVEELVKKLDSIILNPTHIKIVEANVANGNEFGEWSWETISNNMRLIYCDLLNSD